MKDNKKNNKKQPMKYWLVEFTLTSGEVLEFYIKARTQFDAYEKADGYRFWTKDEKLLDNLRTFKLMS